MMVHNNISETDVRGLFVKYEFFEMLDFEEEEVRQACKELENVECDVDGVVIDTENFNTTYSDEDPEEIDRIYSFDEYGERFLK